MQVSHPILKLNEEERVVLNTKHDKKCQCDGAKEKEFNSYEKVVALKIPKKCFYSPLNADKMSHQN